MHLCRSAGVASKKELSQLSRRIQFVDGFGFLRGVLRVEAEFSLVLEPFKFRPLFEWTDFPSMASCLPVEPEFLLCKLELLVKFVLDYYVFVPILRFRLKCRICRCMGVPHMLKLLLLLFSSICFRHSNLLLLFVKFLTIKTCSYPA